MQLTASEALRKHRSLLEKLGSCSEKGLLLSWLNDSPPVIERMEDAVREMERRNNYAIEDFVRQKRDDYRRQLDQDEVMERLEKTGLVSCLICRYAVSYGDILSCHRYPPEYSTYRTEKHPTQFCGEGRLKDER